MKIIDRTQPRRRLAVVIEDEEGRVSLAFAMEIEAVADADGELDLGTTLNRYLNALHGFLADSRPWCLGHAIGAWRNLDTDMLTRPPFEARPQPRKEAMPC